MPQPKGTAIRAASAGTVYLKRFQAGGAGYYLVIRHPGNTYTLYAHMISASPLAIGAAVTAGQTIGRVGATGNATGPHLHFEVQLGGYGNSYRTNPAVFMRNHGINIGC
jgi:murein DD-endopeptidase MepM/ murein hydrolase activator NlpD